jgi:hypothetical protein
MTEPFSRRGAIKMRMDASDVARIVLEDLARRFPDCDTTLDMPAAGGVFAIATLTKRRQRKAKAPKAAT